MPRHYRSFPESYFLILAHFASGETRPFSLAFEALSETRRIRRDLYRFLEALRIASEGGDERALEYHNIFRGLTFKIREDIEGGALLIAELNAMHQRGIDLGEVVKPPSPADPEALRRAILEKMKQGG